MVQFIPDYFKKINLDHFSPEQLNSTIDYWVAAYCYLTQEQRRMKKPKPRMVAGVVVQNAVEKFFKEKKDKQDVTEDAISEYRKECIGMDEFDYEREKVLEMLPDTIINGIKAGMDLGYDKKELESESYISIEIPGIVLPIIGRTDVQTSDKDVDEWKTMWGSKSSRVLKDGSISESWSKPNPPKEPNMGHVKQVATYYKATGISPKIVYVTSKDYAIFDEKSTSLLKADHLEYCIQQFKAAALARQTIVEKSETVDDMFKFVSPDFSYFKYTGFPDEIMIDLKKKWGLI